MADTFVFTSYISKEICKQAGFDAIEALTDEQLQWIADKIGQHLIDEIPDILQTLWNNGYFDEMPTINVLHT